MQAQEPSALLRRYFAEIGPIPVLSAAEEAALARQLREAEDEVRALLEPLPFVAHALVARWRVLRSEGRVTGQLSRLHEPPAGDRSPAVDRIARQLERALAKSGSGARCAALVRAAELHPELLHEVLDELRERAPAGAGPELRATLAAAEAAERRGRAAKDTFLRHNLRLVVHQAKAYRNYGIPFLDLIQEGTLGLIRAVEKFDERLGFRFSTYATWWIQQSCIRAAQHGARTVRLPAPVQDQLRRYRRAAERLATRGPGPPAAAELGSALGAEPCEVERLARLDRPALRLDDPLPGRERGTFAEQLVDASPLGDATADQVRLEREVAGLLGALPSRDQAILRARFGFTDGEGQTLQEVATTLHLSRERVRQLEQRALGRLSAAARAAGLETWLAGGELSG